MKSVQEAESMVSGQASSAQREPSMEEILASIRRIIEDSDSLRSDVVSDRPEHRATGPASVAPVEVEAFRAGLDDSSGHAHDILDALPVARGNPTVVEVAPAPHHDDDHHDLFVEPAETQSPVAVETDEVGLEMDAEAFPELAELIEPLSAEMAADQKPSIISDHAGRQVAAAFGELSEAFAASRRRTFDEMAEEMLRPMLQDWLDNNLPMLVERLVREEIERVARGG